jgi:hypothetical protein
MITAGEGASTGMKTFVEAVDQQIISTALAQLVRPQAGGPIWPIALAWPTRDQERRLWSITLTELRACDDSDVDPEMVFVVEPAQTMRIQMISTAKIKSRYRLSRIRQGIFQFLLLL